MGIWGDPGAVWGAPCRDRRAAVGVAGLALAALLLAAGPARATTIRVLLTRSDGPLVVIVAGRSIRLTPAEGGVASERGGPIVPVWTARGAGPFEVAGMRVWGRLDVRRAEPGLMAVVEVPVEEYVAGAMAGEMPASWLPAALRAQAVASRTYALHQQRSRQNDFYDVEATTTSQVYAGPEAADREPSIRAAVEATRGEVLTWRGDPILAAFHAASGGHTASAREVWGEDVEYLVGREVDGEDDAPDTYWRAEVSQSTVGDALAAAGWPIGEVETAEVVERSASGRVVRIRLQGRRGEAVLDGRQLRSALGETTIKSTLFELQVRDGQLVFVGSGNGHGVGMSQWAAQAMAREGADYREILERFYPGTRLERIGADVASSGDARRAHGGGEGR